MKAIFLASTILLSGIASAQLSPREAELRVSNSQYLPAPKAALIWSLTAPDADLIEALRSERQPRALAVALEVANRPDPALISALAKALPKTRDPRFGLAILVSLNKLKTEGARRTVENAVKHPVKEIRWSAAEMSAKRGYRAALATLVEAVNNDQIEAVRVMPLIGGPAEAHFVRAFYDRSLKKPYGGWGANTDHTAVLTLVAMRDPWATAQVRHEIDHPTDRFYRADAVHELGLLRMPADIPRFTRTLDDPYMHVRFMAAEALGFAGAKGAVASLSALAAKPGRDAVQGRTSDAQGRGYVEYVVQCLKQGKPTMAIREWNGHNPVFSFNDKVRVRSN
jgi:hypothetical protein